jgi:hypothetical protein
MTSDKKPQPVFDGKESKLKVHLSKMMLSRCFEAVRAGFKKK